jgi:branched-chain amino acid transport system substrate-binding protein
MPSRFARGRSALAVVFILTGAACGSGGSGQQASPARPAAQSEPVSPAGAPAGTPASPAAAPASDALPAAASSSALPTPAPAGPTLAAAPKAATAAAAAAKADGGPKPVAAASPAPGGGAASAPAPGGVAGGNGGGGAAPAPGAPAAGPADTAPIVIGSVGTLSGPAGSTIRQTSEGVKVWAAWANSHGGAAGHPVKLIIQDDGGDPSRYRSELQTLVEKDNVVALVGNADALTGAAGVDYVTAKSVPYIGGDGGGDWFYQGPTYFPQGAVGEALMESEIYDAGEYARLQGKKKFGIVTCQEADICRRSHRIFTAKAADAGLDLVYQAQTSLTQPDFTAECLAAQRAGAELVELMLDANSIRRFSQSCARQSYHPFLGWPAGIAQEDEKDEPALEGARTTLFTFSWIDRSNPAALEFADAIARFGKDLKPITAGHTGGWTAGKLLEKAILAVPGKVTRESVLAGLWTLKNETLGGLTSPLTFTKGQNAPRSKCWTTVAIKGGKWIALRDGKFVCH